MKPEGHITWNGGQIVAQGERDIGIEIWLRDQRGYSFSANIKINKSELERPEYSDYVSIDGKSNK